MENKRISNLEEFADPNDMNHQDSVWYDGIILRYIVDNRFQVAVVAAGEKSIYYKKIDDHINLPDYDIENDKQLQKQIKNGNIIFDANNWFEYSIVDMKTNEYLDIDGDNILDNLKQCWDYSIPLKAISDYLAEEKEEQESRKR